MLVSQSALVLPHLLLLALRTPSGEEGWIPLQSRHKPHQRRLALVVGQQTLHLLLVHELDQLPIGHDLRVSGEGRPDGTRHGGHAGDEVVHISRDDGIAVGTQTQWSHLAHIRIVHFAARPGPPYGEPGAGEKEIAAVRERGEADKVLRREAGRERRERKERKGPRQQRLQAERVHDGFAVLRGRQRGVEEVGGREGAFQNGSAQCRRVKGLCHGVRHLRG